MNEAEQTFIIENFKNTVMGLVRVKKNLAILHLSDAETANYLRRLIALTPLENIESRGKNHYFKCIKSNAILTINASSLTVITAKQIEK